MREPARTDAGGRLASIRFRAGIGGEPIVQEVLESVAHTFEPAPWGAWLVNPPGHPAPGSQAGLRVSIGVGCCAEIRSRPAGPVEDEELHGAGPADGSPSESAVSAQVSVASDGMLSWAPQPGAAGAGRHHRSDSVVQLASSARLMWCDEFLVGGPGNGPLGTWRSRLRITRDGWPVVSSEWAIGPGWPLWESPAVLSGARAVSVMVVVDPGRAADRWASAGVKGDSATGVALPLNGPGVQIVAWGTTPADCRAAAETLLDPSGVPDWAAGRWAGGRRFGRVAFQHAQ